jgi:hypothetical protein
MDAVEFGGGCDRHLMARKVLGKAVQVMVIFATMMLVFNFQKSATASRSLELGMRSLFDM